MNIKDLSKFNINDLRKIDIEEVKFFLMQRIDISVCLALGVLTIFLIIGFFGRSNLAASAMSREVITKKDLLVAVNEQKQIEKEVEEYKKKFPENINSDQLIDKLSNLAVDHGVQIESLSPIHETADTFKKTVSLDITITSPDYEKLILFSKDIESLPYGIRIDNWSGSMQPLQRQAQRSQFARQAQAQNDQEESIEASIQISLVQLLP